jgi:hypothetical protein
MFNEVQRIIELDYEDAKVADRLHSKQETCWEEYSRATKEYGAQLELFYRKHCPFKPGDRVDPELSFKDGYLVVLRS